MIYRCFLIIYSSFLSFGQERKRIFNKMEWFQQAKLGILTGEFVKLMGLVSLGHFLMNIYPMRYMKQLNGFNQKN